MELSLEPNESLNVGKDLANAEGTASDIFDESFLFLSVRPVEMSAFVSKCPF